MFSGCPMPPDTKEKKLGSDDQEHPPSASKNTGFSFSAAHESVPTAISGSVDIPDVPGCHLLQQMSSQ